MSRGPKGDIGAVYGLRRKGVGFEVYKVKGVE